MNGQSFSISTLFSFYFNSVVHSAQKKCVCKAILFINEWKIVWIFHHDFEAKKRGTQKSTPSLRTGSPIKECLSSCELSPKTFSLYPPPPPPIKQDGMGCRKEGKCLRAKFWMNEMKFSYQEEEKEELCIKDFL